VNRAQIDRALEVFGRVVAGAAVTAR